MNIVEKSIIFQYLAKKFEKLHIFQIFVLWPGETYVKVVCHESRVFE